jgi:hypothetical protein
MSWLIGAYIWVVTCEIEPWSQSYDHCVSIPMWKKLFQNVVSYLGICYAVNSYSAGIVTRDRRIG